MLVKNVSHSIESRFLLALDDDKLLKVGRLVDSCIFKDWQSLYKVYTTGYINQTKPLSWFMLRK